MCPFICLAQPTQKGSYLAFNISFNILEVKLRRGRGDTCIDNQIETMRHFYRVCTTCVFVQKKEQYLPDTTSYLELSLVWSLEMSRTRNVSKQCLQDTLCNQYSSCKSVYMYQFHMMYRMETDITARRPMFNFIRDHNLYQKCT